MSDGRLAELRRRTAQGEAGARAALLAERLRSGDDLTRERLELAAYLGDLDAQVAGSVGEIPRPSLKGWAGGLVRWGRVAAVRACVAALRSDVSEAGVAPTCPPIERWLVCPCPRHEAEVLALWPSTCAQDAEDPFDPRFQLLGLAIDSNTDRVAAAVVTTIAGCVRWQTPHRCVPADEARVRGAVLDEVVPWALGERDPVRARLEATS